MRANRISDALIAVCPIRSVTIGDDTDPTTWAVAPAADASPEQIAAAEAVLAAIRSAGTVPPTEAEYATAIQAHIDAAAVSRRYTDGVFLATYATSSVPERAAEAAAFIAWRDEVWTFAYAKLAAVTAGTEPVPSIDELIASLPVISWP